MAPRMALSALGGAWCRACAASWAWWPSVTAAAAVVLLCIRPGVPVIGGAA